MQKRRRRWGYLVVVAVVALALWPSPDPLAEVRTVALAAPEGGAKLASEVFQGLEVALENHRIRVVPDEAQAEAVIRLEPQSARIELDENGLRAVVRCLLTKDGRQSTLELHVTVDENGLRAEFVKRRFWQLWKSF